MLSNAYFLAKFRFDTAENEPAQNLQKFANFLNFDVKSPQPARGGTDLAEVRLRMAESLKQAVGYIEQGQIRLGPEPG